MMDAAGEAERRQRGEALPPAMGGVLWRARAALFWENVWRTATPMLGVAGAFLILAWAGARQALPDLFRLPLVAAFVMAAIAAALPLSRLRWPDRAAALARLERVNGLADRPLATLEDSLSNDADRGTRALWQAHRRRLVARLGNLSAGTPSPRADRRDPYSLRALLLLLLVAAAAHAGDARLQLLASAFRPPAIATPPDLRIDAWLNPPAYTGRPPQLLAAEAAAPPLTVPEGSLVVVRMPAAAGLALVVETEAGRKSAEPVSPDAANSANGQAASALLEYRLPLATASRLTVEGKGNTLRDWTFAVEDDADPTIEVLDQPAATASGALSLKYRLADDYGVVAATALFEQPKADGKGDARPLYGAPDFPLRLPQARVRDGRAETVRNLTAHPWAGATAIMTLVARDEAGQEGKSDRVRMTLPGRRFGNPLSRAIIEQRRWLALDANAAPRVADALAAVMIAPERFMPDRNVYLGLVVAHRRLLDAASDDDLRGVVDLLWEIALSIEDGRLSLEAEAVRAAADKLMEALENGASDEEISRLTDELRAALAKFMQALAERQPDANAPLDRDAMTITPQDLDRMLGELENLAKSGARDAARQMLSELQRMMENLETGNSGQSDPVAGEMNKAMEELADMIRRQQQLMDETFQFDQGRKVPGDSSNDGETGGPGAEELRRQFNDIARQQHQLQQALENLAKGLESLGDGKNEALDRAGREMGEAARNLGRGFSGPALGNQGEALRNLREGAESLAEQMAERQRAGRGGRCGRSGGREDPLGRPDRTFGPQFGDSVKVPDEIDAARARQILEEIRRRLGEAARPDLERDYLERLLRRY
ncbi:MAG: TIGR02302 family protein [Hyphomicrobiales bacterium]